MPYSTRRLIGRAVQTAPFFRIMPSGSLRVFSGVRFHYARSNWSNVTALARTDIREATRYRSSGMLAARAAFYKAEDDLAESLIEALLKRFPAEPGIFDIRADIARFQGRYSEALADAERARFLAPSSRNAVAKVMRYSYFAHPPEVADRINLDELRRYPRSVRLYMAAAYGCRESQQFERILQTWQEHDQPESITSKVDALAVAAERAGEIAAACQLYRDAIQVAAQVATPEAEVRGTGVVPIMPVLLDVHEVMKQTNVPYVFVGDTALGLARRGAEHYLEPGGEVEVGVLADVWDRSWLEEVFSADPRFAPMQQLPAAKGIRLVHRLNVNVNILRFYLADGKLWHDRIGSRKWNTPFEPETHRFGDHEVQLPSDLVTYLQETYRDTGVPASRWFDDGPNAEVIRPEYARLTMLRRAFEQIRAGDRVRAARELSRAEEDELARVVEVSGG